jgi:SHS2 domain-containing protein
MRIGPHFKKSGILKGMVQTAGFHELQHTADWEIEAWAPDLPKLFEQAAIGMYAMSGTNLYPEPRITRKLELDAEDAESLLVKFLTELLFMGEQYGLAFDVFELQIDGSSLHARLHGAPMTEQTKEIKAVTYHKLAIQPDPRGLVVRIVFDV